MMQLLVLGYLPGTNIQITFDMIATLFVVTALIYLSLLVFKEEKALRIKKQDTIEITKYIESTSI